MTVKTENVRKFDSTIPVYDFGGEYIDCGTDDFGTGAGQINAVGYLDSITSIGEAGKLVVLVNHNENSDGTVTNRKWQLAMARRGSGTANNGRVSTTVISGGASGTDLPGSYAS